MDLQERAAITIALSALVLAFIFFAIHGGYTVETYPTGLEHLPR